MHTSFIAAAAAVALGSAASADIVEMSFAGAGLGRNVRLGMGEASVIAFAGQLRHDVTDATGRGAALLGSQTTFCTDIYQAVSPLALEYHLGGLTDVPNARPMSPATAAAVEELFTQAEGRQLDPTGSADFAAAFQLALWEIVSDFDAGAGRAGLSLHDGWFTAAQPNRSALAPGIAAYADELFSAVGSGHRAVQLISLRSNAAQDQLAVVPAPGASGVFGLGLLLAAARRQR